MIELREPEAIRAELYEAERIAEITALEVGAQRDVLASDALDGGRVTSASFRSARAGNRTNAYERVKGLDELAKRRQERREAVRRVQQLRDELSVWTARVPVGMLEIAALLGYGPDAPRQWKRRNVLPAPAGSVSGTPYWWRSDVLRWALEKGRTRAFVSDDGAGFAGSTDDYAEAV